MADELKSEGGKPYYDTAPLDKDFINNLKSHVVRNLQELERICNVEKKIVGFDTETTGLTFFKDKVVGCSISFNGTSGFYIPLRHENEDGTLAEYNLPFKESLDLIYNKLLKRNTILLYNSSYDLTMVGQELDLLGLPFTDIETIKFIDVQNLVYLLEPEVKKNNLKWATRHFLGRIAPEFEQITGISKRSKTNKHFGCINPWIKTTIVMKPVELKGAKKKFTEADILHNQDCLALPSYEASAGQYASADSANTYALFEKLMPVAEKMWQAHNQSGHNTPFAFQTDCKFAKAMLYYKHVPISINAKLMKDNLKKVETRLEEIQQQIYETAGEVFNMKSTPQKRAIFAKLGIDTGVQTKTGMSVSVQAIKGIDHPIIGLLTEYSALQKRKSAYFEPLSKNMIGRINYRTCATATGRLSSGADKGNTYHSSISIQTLPKCANQMYLLEKAQEGEKGANIILGYKYTSVDDKFVEEHPNSTYVEGFKQDLAIRSCLCSPHHIYVENPDTKEKLDFNFDIVKAEQYCRHNGYDLSCINPELSDDWLVVSADFSGEELCLIADLSLEPSFVEPLLHGDDLHKTIAKKMYRGSTPWEELDKATRKNLRKKAKSCNFGLCYKGSYKVLLKEIPDEEDAMQTFTSWWDNMPIYKHWQNKKIQEMMTLHDGDAINYYGRKRRFRPMLQTGNQSIINSAIRAACNHFIQGTAADIMRIIMSELYEKYFKQGENSDEIRFLASIHDEVAVAIRKDVLDKWVYRLVTTMEDCVPKEFVVPFTACPQIGPSLGFGFDFVFDRDKNHKPIPGTLHPKV